MAGPVLLLLLLVGACSCVAVLDCPPLPPRVPANVSDLSPGDIKVIMALGDSMTAGFGIYGKEGGLNEYRGLSFSMGGDPNATTVPNFLKLYNPALQGASVGSHMIEFCAGSTCPPDQYRPDKDVLNAAQSGAMMEDLEVHEFAYLLAQLNSNPNISMKEDWKLLTIFIGANDLCESCENVERGFLDPDAFEEHLSAVLEEVRLNIPRVFVQLVEIFNLSQVYDLSRKTNSCLDSHRGSLFIECDCIFSPEANKTRQAVDIYAQAYNERSRKIAATYQASNYPEFTVVAQPAGRDTVVRDLSPDMLSTLDCFHPSLLAQQAMAVALWNNMITPAAHKKRVFDPNQKPLCPTAETRLYTN